MIADLFCSPLVTLKAQETRDAKKVLAPTPPMGWNSWDSYGLRINEQQFRDNVEALTTKLKPFGYIYAVIDEG
jgi:alpha-galactosidase